MISSERMREVVRAWLSSELTEDRHRRRVAKIELSSANTEVTLKTRRAGQSI